MKTLIKLIMIGAFLFGCQPSPNKSDILNATYNFKHILYVYYGSDEGGWQPHFGSITINESLIQIKVNANGNETTDSFTIKKVIYEKDKSEYEYQTNKGKIIVKMENNTIKEVQNYTSIGMAIFATENYKEKKQTMN